MSVTSLMTQSVTVYRTVSLARDSIGAGAITETGNSVMAYLEPKTSDEDLASRNTQIGDWRAFVPPDTDVTGWDRVAYGSRTFDILGPPRPMWNARTATVSHYELDLREVV